MEKKPTNAAIIILLVIVAGLAALLVRLHFNQAPPTDNQLAAVNSADDLPTEMEVADRADRQQGAPDAQAGERGNDDGAAQVNSSSTDLPDSSWPKQGSLAELKFAAYPVERFNGSLVLPTFSGTQRAYERFRTELIDEAKHGPNFAGLYRIAELGCGTECVFRFLIDEQTGLVSDFDIGGHGGGEESRTQDTRYRLESNLLLEVASDPDRSDVCVYNAYKWADRRLQLVTTSTLPLPEGESSDLQGCVR